MWVLDLVNAATQSVDASYHLIAGEWSIGRKKCHFNFSSDSSISRSHAMLRVGALTDTSVHDPATRPKLVLVDQNSRFGSFVNDEQCLHERELGNGDLVTFGAKRTVLRVRYQAFVLVASRILRSNRARVNDACARIGMHLITVASKDATHCIMDPGRIVATVKVLWALVYNQPVVTTAWIYAILERKSMSEPLPRCEQFVPVDESMPLVAAPNYMPNILRKSLYQRHVVVFLVPQTMEELIAAMDGIVVAAYRYVSNDQDEQLLRAIEQHTASRHVLVVEPSVSGGFSSTAASSDVHTKDMASIAGASSAGTNAVVERRVEVFQSSGATFVTIQQLAASVLFAKAPEVSNQCSFHNSINPSVAIPIASFPEHLSLHPVKAENDDDESDDDGEDQVKPEKPNLYDSERPSHASQEFNILSLTDPFAPQRNVDVEVIDPVKLEQPAFDSTTAQADLSVTGILDDSSDNDLASIDAVGTDNKSWIDGTQARSEWIPVKQGFSGRKRPIDDSSEDEKLHPLVLSCNLVVKQPIMAPSNAASNTNFPNFKRFKKGNGYGSQRMHSLFPKQTVISVTVDNAARKEMFEEIDSLAEQERIAQELFEMVEGRTVRRRR